MAIIADDFVNEAFNKLDTIAADVAVARHKIVNIRNQANAEATAAIERIVAATNAINEAQENLAAVAAVATATKEKAFIANNTAEIEAVANEARTATADAAKIMATAQAILHEAEAAADDARWGNTIIIDLEIQNKFNLDYWLLNRASYYAGRLTSKQDGTEFAKFEYNQLKRVYSVWICLDPPEDLKNRGKWYPSDEQDLSLLPGYYVKQLRATNIVLLGIGGPKADNYQGIFKMLHVILLSRDSLKRKQQILEKEFGLKLSKSDLRKLKNVSVIGHNLPLRSSR